MEFRLLAAASLLAALGLVAGCGTEEPGEPTAGGDSEWSDTADERPTPDSTSPGTAEPEGGSQMAGGQDGGMGQSPSGQMSGQQGQPGTQTQEGGGQMGMTEFAALDTDSDGRIQEEDWRPELMNGMEFDQVDQDGSGDIDRQEFQQAVAGQGQQSPTTGAGGSDPEDPTGP